MPSEPDGQPSRAYVLPDSTAGADDAADVVRRAAALGFDTLRVRLDPGVFEDAADASPALKAWADSARTAGLRLVAELPPLVLPADSVLVTAASRAFRSGVGGAGVADPRRPETLLDGHAYLVGPDPDGAVADWLADRLRPLLTLTDAVATSSAPLMRVLQALADDGRAPSLEPGGPDRSVFEARLPPGGSAAEPVRKGQLAEAALAGRPWLMDGGLEDALADAVSSVNALLADRVTRSSVRRLTARGAPFDVRLATLGQDRLLMIRSALDAAAEGPEPTLYLSRPEPVSGFGGDGPFGPGETRLWRGAPPRPVRVPRKRAGATLKAATDPAARVVIASLSPSVDGGEFAVKRVTGDLLEVRAGIFADGHEQLAAELLIKADDETDWRRIPMVEEPNDEWTAQAALARLGPHAFCVEAWLDAWGGFVRDFRKKRDAGLDLSLEIREGRALMEMAAHGDEAVAGFLAALDAASPERQPALLLDPALQAAMRRAETPRFRARSFVQPLEVEREAARFSSWYELFPRSQTSDKSRHGTFRDVIGQLPRVEAMGFDTLYFTPIHPIGRRNRKGPNNTLTPGPDDVGSPYAIGAAEGGHTDIHPQLGTLQDFRELVAAARDHGLEIALDFAIQCAPDHPWLTTHPGWFAWRPDGSMKYAENPPKKYQDIVNVDFYGPDAVPGLWEALRDVVLFWAAEGVRTFRVDNPHTKPMPFWRWMIAEVKRDYPDVIFLSEAFTRPKPMYHLAKVGFSQSYTYFTWRNSKAELSAYFTELTTTGVREFFRPHLFVNTPDINPFFLQTSGRAGFLIRAALGATLSGLFGVYAGFELCEDAALPGREEYLDSEKYEIRVRPDRRPGDIVDEIARLNRLRREFPHLQSHLGLAFHNAFNDNVLYYARSAPGHDDRLLVAVSLDPHHAQEADFEVPLWEFGLEDWDSVEAEDLLEDRVFRWTGKMQRVRLTPERPYAIWRIAPRRGGAR